MREDVISRSPQQDFLDTDQPAPLTNWLGQAALIVGGAALVAFATRERSWRTLGLAAAGAPLL